MRPLSHVEKQLFRDATGRDAPYCLVQRWPWWWRDFRGIALGPLVLVKDDDPVLVCHELAHVAQFRADPFGFWLRYAAWLVWFGYGANPYEVEARRVAGAVQRVLGNALRTATK